MNKALQCNWPGTVGLGAPRLASVWCGVAWAGGPLNKALRYCKGSLRQGEARLSRVRPGEVGQGPKVP